MAGFEFGASGRGRRAEDCMPCRFGVIPTDSDHFYGVGDGDCAPTGRGRRQRANPYLGGTA